MNKESESKEVRGFLYEKALLELRKRAKNGKVRIPEINHAFGCLFHLSKKEIWAVLKELAEDGHIRIVPFHGIELMGVLDSAE